MGMRGFRLGKLGKGRGRMGEGRRRMLINARGRVLGMWRAGAAAGCQLQQERGHHRLKVPRGLGLKKDGSGREGRCWGCSGVPLRAASFGRMHNPYTSDAPA